MSIDILGISPNKLGSYFTKIFNMDIENQLSLGDFVRKTRVSKGLSTTRVEELSKAGGAKGITDGYISQIEAGYIRNVSPDKLKALARGLTIAEEEIFAIARGIVPDGQLITNERFSKISLGYLILSDAERESIEPLVNAIELVVGRALNRQRIEEDKFATKSVRKNMAGAVPPVVPAAESLNFSGNATKNGSKREALINEVREGMAKADKEKKKK